jgi:hypothetical protein
MKNQSDLLEIETKLTNTNPTENIICISKSYEVNKIQKP